MTRPDKSSIKQAEHIGSPAERPFDPQPCAPAPRLARQTDRHPRATRLPRRGRGARATACTRAGTVAQCGAVTRAQPMPRRFVPAVAVGLVLALVAVSAQQQTGLSPDDPAERVATEKDLQSIAVVDRKGMVPMRDGVRLATDSYRPKDATGPVPIVFVR